MVRNERRQSVENTPYGKAEVRLVELLFPKPHPYFGAVIGSHEDLQAATLEDVKSFFRTFYAPATPRWSSSATSTRRRRGPWWRSTSAPSRAAAKPPPPAVQTQPITRQVRETLTDDVQLSRLFVGVIAPPAWSDDGFAYDVAAGDPRRREDRAASTAR